MTSTVYPDRHMMRRRNRSHRLVPRVRTAFTLVELIGTCLLLGVLFSVTVPMLLIVARERHTNEQRQVAMQQAVNLMESVSARSWEELSPGDLAIPDLDADLRTVLPGIEQTLTSVDADGDIEARQIIASIRWRHRSGQMLPPVQLSTWVFHSGKAQ